MVLLLGAVVTLKGFNRLAVAFDALASRQLLNFGVTLSASRYPDDQRTSIWAYACGWATRRLRGSRSWAWSPI
jgi:hypothetical protein